MIALPKYRDSVQVCAAIEALEDKVSGLGVRDLRLEIAGKALTGCIMAAVHQAASARVPLRSPKEIVEHALDIADALIEATK